MDVIAEAPFVQETLSIVDSSVWHDQFDREIWQGKDSFHNREHLRATEITAQKLIDAAIEGNDPLKIRAELGRWNEDHPDVRIDLTEFKKVARVFINRHDDGNVIKEVKIVDGKPQVAFLDKYEAAGAEERSKEITKAMLPYSDLTESEQQRFEPLIMELIEQTKFVEDKNRINYFATFARVCDQIGNDLFSNNESRVQGLINEMVSENPEAEFRPSPYFFYNFARERFPQLVPDSSVREAVYKIWGRTEREEKAGYPKVPAKMTEYTAQRKLATELVAKHGMVNRAAEEEFRKKSGGKSLDEILPMRGYDQIPKPTAA